MGILPPRPPAGGLLLIGGLVVAVLVIVVALAGTGAYFVLRNLQKTVTGEAEANVQMDAVRARYAPRVPLVEVVDPRAGNIQINREPGPATPPVKPST